MLPLAVMRLQESVHASSASIQNKSEANMVLCLIQELLARWATDSRQLKTLGKLKTLKALKTLKNPQTHLFCEFSSLCVCCGKRGRT